MRKTLQVALSFLLLLSLMGCGDSGSSQVAFLQFSGGNYKLLIGTLDSKGLTTTEVGQAAGYYSAFLSPDGKKLAYDVRDANSNDVIMVANSDGSQAVQISDGKWADAPVFSPDGQKVLWNQDMGRSGSYDLVVANTDGSGSPTNLTFNTGGVVDFFHQNYSPDGQKIVASGEANCFNIYTMNPDGTNLKAITNNTDCNVGYHFPTFSPDGKKIFFSVHTRSVSATTYDIYSMNVDGSALTNVTKSGTDLSPRFVGNRIVFVSIRDGNQELYSMMPDGSDVVRLTNNTVNDLFDTNMSVSILGPAMTQSRRSGAIFEH